MLSTIPPPRPVSVNSLARLPASPSLTYQKTGRSTSGEIPAYDGPNDPPPAVTRPLECSDADDTEMEDISLAAEEQRPENRTGIRFENLPIEIHEAILDHLFGERVSASSAGGSTIRSWAKALRHPRRKVLSNLALICPVWRQLVQGRIYRHIKVKGTIDGLAESTTWFQEHPYLAAHVRHIEIWVPVWGNRANKNAALHQPPARRYQNEDTGLADVTAMLQVSMAWVTSDTHHGNNCNYHYASHNATMEEIFDHVQDHFSDARILTLEGGHCKKPPMILHFRSPMSDGKHLAELPNIQVFVMRGAWNIMRDYEHWCNIARALPSLRDWDCAYAKPKPECYGTLSKVLTTLPISLSHMNINLDGFYSKDNIQSAWFGGDGSNPEPHLCRLLGEVAPRLETLTFTGKLCVCVFHAARLVASKLQSEARLKSLDLVVKTCCREKRSDLGLPLLDDAAGITNLRFIRSFEKLVIGAIRALEFFPRLDCIRIRFIDLDSACPLLNPYFQMTKNRCTGIWSPAILDALADVRPQAYYVELADGIYPQYGPNHQIVGAVYPRARPQSIQVNMYKIIADASKP
ncbi:hypothetical protein ASPZODRAFT_148996 [Penicilliopsis zonata CBS 506.65]|uniref:Uncharacterized protein n=1 Tax=Penicilliopsis zonata CBS 506.65 TaxID=1073090 RepID=A0A1L9SX93_9EURO|nr:hypothetical protein ASPZODRAFT_148996 [Penicilliopsis zonata CBS 506.65]OJJ51769.1 hypothetical protein ASPZODRAFT_148996 [Penicilliopsis zonata CBS 506.65]